MREANEDLKAVPVRPEWNAPVITMIAAEDAEGNAVTTEPDGVLSIS